MAKTSDVIKGLTILAKYAKNGLEEHMGGASHDTLYGPVAGRLEKLTEEDRASLKEAGWHFDSGCDSWARFV